MTVGILGGGQLGRMLALAGVPLGLRCRCLDPSPEAPAGQVAELVTGAYDDPAALERFAAGLEVATYEFENVPAAATRFLEGRVPVYPPARALEVGQDRLLEKRFFQELGIPTAPFAAVGTRAELEAAAAELGLPAVLKTRRFGYDGKGQRVLRAPEELAPAWEALGGRPLLLEQFVAFEREVSVLAVRGRDGATACYPLVENHHRDGILALSLAPAPGLTPELQAEGERAAERVLAALGYVGVLAIEFFQAPIPTGSSGRAEGRLVANELAPRVHNSGHWTIEGAETSQFENHLRAILGLPLGSTAARGCAALVNLIGELPPPEAVLALPGAHLHRYGKTPAPGRKLGHVTLRADEPGVLAERLTALRGVAGCRLPGGWQV